MSEFPVGIFDSGVGGLSVAREIRRALPRERLLYVADTAHCPYGDRPAEEVRGRALVIGRWLEEQGAKVVVVACNTASGAALEQLREQLRIPVIGLEPAVKTAVGLTRSGRVGVMATSGTLRSERFARLLQNHARDVTVVAQACPGLADLIEDGHLDGPVFGAALDRHVAPLRAADVDTVVLGCTHYPFATDAIAQALGPQVTLVDCAPAIARRVRQILGDAVNGGGDGGLEVLTTGEPPEVRAVVARLWGSDVPVGHLDV